MDANDIITALVERVVELKLNPKQKFKVELSSDIMEDIIGNATFNGVKHLRCPDGGVSFFLSMDGKWSPKVYQVDSLPKGTFNIILVDK